MTIMFSTQSRQYPGSLELSVLHEIARVAGIAAGASKVVLFGSAARADTHGWSDLDWLLVIPDEKFGTGFLQQSQPALQAAQALEEANLYVCPMDFVPVRATSFESGAFTLARVAAREGRVLYKLNPPATSSTCPVK
jgi:predicted nucleotidyltransferase